MATKLSEPVSRDCVPTRHCPHCDHAEPLEKGKLLWPLAWTCTACGKGLAFRNGFVQLDPALDDIDKGFDLGSFDLLAEVEAGHFWFVSRNELIRWLVQRFAPAAQRALEIGCGTGFVLQSWRSILPEAQIAGSELHSLGLTHARSRCDAGVELFQMDARSGRLVNALDLIGVFDVLEHIPEDERVLAEVYRMLRPGGHLIVTVPQHPWLWSTADDLAKHQRRYTVGEMSCKVRAAGFVTRYQTSFVTLALPLMVASRVLARLQPKPRTLAEQTDAEFRLLRCQQAAAAAVPSGAIAQACRAALARRRLARARRPKAGLGRVAPAW